MEVGQFQGFSRLIRNLRFIHSDSFAFVDDGHIYWDLGKLTVFLCKTFCLHHRHVGSWGRLISVSLVTFWRTVCRGCTNIYGLFQKILAPLAMIMSRFGAYHMQGV